MRGEFRIFEEKNEEWTTGFSFFHFYIRGVFVVDRLIIDKR